VSLQDESEDEAKLDDNRSNAAQTRVNARLFELPLAAGVVEFILSADNLSVRKRNVYIYTKEKEETWDRNGKDTLTGIAGAEDGASTRVIHHLIDQPRTDTARSSHLEFPSRSGR
jgi:hypothetical protein